MLTNFEKETYDLTPEELDILPHIIDGFKRYKKDSPVKSAEIVKAINPFLQNRGYRLNVCGVRIRKFVNYIRKNGLLPLIATSKGYYITDDKEEILKQIKSLKERANSINICAKGLEIYL